MSDVILGLDLGANSIGWALIDEEGQRLLSAGVRVFPEGVDRDQQGGEVSKNVQRRMARSIRRQIARRSRRKAKLRTLLLESGLLPAVAGLPREDPQRVRWEHETYQAVDPYTLRRRALREKLGPEELGRLLLHLNQRRGFESNRRADRAKRKETSEMLREISGLAEDMGDKTLGEYLADLRDDDPTRHHFTRLRGMHTNRAMYRQELDRIWSVQQHHHPGLLTDDLKQRVDEIIFFQRRMYWPASVIGHCEIEPRHPRCPRPPHRCRTS